MIVDERIVDERTRRLVHEWAARSAGPDVADALMAMLPPFPTEEIATGADLERMTAGLRGEMSELRAELRGEMSELRGNMAQLDAGLRGEMFELRGEVRGLLPRLYAANLLAMMGVAGLVLAAASIA